MQQELFSVALCDILGCGPGELIEPVTIAVVRKPATSPPTSPPRPVRAGIGTPGR